MDEQDLFSTHLQGLTPSGKRSGTIPLVSAPVDWWFYERSYITNGYKTIAGLDEAGRGPLAGPVVAACVVLPESFTCDGINDSKQLTSKQRNDAYERIIAAALLVGVGIVEHDEIDQINILRATHAAMRKAVAALPIAPQVLLIDGLPVPQLADCEHKAIVRGDALSISIATASVVAKVTRDRLMCIYATTYPEYGFELHKGYASEQHLLALRTHGPCPIHRRSFAPVAALLQPVLL